MEMGMEMEMEIARKVRAQCRHGISGDMAFVALPKAFTEIRNAGNEPPTRKLEDSETRRWIRLIKWDARPSKRTLFY